MLVEVSDEFAENYSHFCSKNASFKKAVDDKIEQLKLVLSDYPNHFKPLRGPLKGFRRVHVFSSFVIIFQFFEKEKIIRLISLAHHDKAYDA
ncbi:type II toxin-antitoxin system mRNA interferase toxin, RelE/StbE family [Candidatus Micrarchaeota archaeon]|nr:type II toxin-antitoxin system mRNA interferase toxin, RelE/StbE family [Candidatus Micrarchaeota archaeon]